MQNLQTGGMEPLTQKRYVEEKKKGTPALFAVGEILDLRGGRFAIKSIGRKMMILEGIPGTRVEELEIVARPAKT